MLLHSTPCSCWLWPGWAAPAGSCPCARLWGPSLGNSPLCLARKFPGHWGRQPDGPPWLRGPHSNVSGHAPRRLPWSSLERGWSLAGQRGRGSHQPHLAASTICLQVRDGCVALNPGTTSGTWSGGSSLGHWDLLTSKGPKETTVPDGGQ